MNLNEKRVVFQNGRGGVCVLIPMDCGLSIEEIAAKDVPPGKPYKIVDASEIPEDRTARENWFVDEAGSGGMAIKIADAPIAPAEPPVLDAPRFEYMLAYTGLDDVWDALFAALRESDRAAYASLKAQRAKGVFHLDVTLALVETYRSQAEQAAPDADLSAETITAAWDAAALAVV